MELHLALHVVAKNVEKSWLYING